MAKRKTSKEYGALIRRVRKIDPKAADWMRDVAPTLGNTFKPHKDLIRCFIWSLSPQGHAYWSSIHKALTQVEGRSCIGLE